MYSNLAKTNYEMKDMILSSLRNRIIEENNLTPLDILKGFHEKSKIDLEYESAATEQNLQKISLIEKEYERYLIDLVKNNIQDVYDTEFNSAFEKAKQSCPNLTLEDVITYNEKGEKGKNLSVSVKDASWQFIRALKDLDTSLKRKFLKDTNTYIESYIKKNYGNIYCIDCRSYWNNILGLPHSMEVNAPIDIDFSEVYELCKDFNGSFSDWFEVEYDTHIGSKEELQFAKYDKPKISVHLTETQAKELFDKAINAVIYQNNCIGELEYLQNLEAQPITININTKTNKCELIDGYKRLLYITDEKLLSYNAPVRVFTDLDDSQFLALLYAANVWKTKELFHDRGFLFALKTRFNFVIPLSAYDNKGNIRLDELSTIQLYDFAGNLAHVDKSVIMNTLHNHKFFVSDMRVLYNFLPQQAEKYSYDRNILEEIMFSIIELVGEARRTKDNDIQKELSEELITSIFEDDSIKTACSKKHLSSRTYVMNYFRDKGLYKRIIEMIKKGLFND